MDSHSNGEKHCNDETPVTPSQLRLFQRADEAEELPSVQGNTIISVQKSRLFTVSILSLKHNSEKFSQTSAVEVKACALAGGTGKATRLDHECEQNKGSNKSVEKLEFSTKCMQDLCNNEQSVGRAKRATCQLFKCVDAKSSAHNKAFRQSSAHLDSSTTVMLDKKYDGTDTKCERDRISASKNLCTKIKSSCRRRDQWFDQQVLGERVHTAQGRSSSLVNCACNNKSVECQQIQSYNTVIKDSGLQIVKLGGSHGGMLRDENMIQSLEHFHEKQITNTHISSVETLEKGRKLICKNMDAETSWERRRNEDVKHKLKKATKRGVKRTKQKSHNGNFDRFDVNVVDYHLVSSDCQPYLARVASNIDGLEATKQTGGCSTRSLGRYKDDMKSIQVFENSQLQAVAPIGACLFGVRQRPQGKIGSGSTHEKRAVKEETGSNIAMKQIGKQSAKACGRLNVNLHLVAETSPEPGATSMTSKLTTAKKTDFHKKLAIETVTKSAAQAPNDKPKNRRQCRNKKTQRLTNSNIPSNTCKNDAISSADNSQVKKKSGNRYEQAVFSGSSHSVSDEKCSLSPIAIEKERKLLESFSCELVIKDTQAVASKDVSQFNCKSKATQLEKRSDLIEAENWELELLECCAIDSKCQMVAHDTNDVDSVGVYLDGIETSGGIGPYAIDIPLFAAMFSFPCDASTEESHTSYIPRTPTSGELKCNFEETEENQQLSADPIMKYSYMEDWVDEDNKKLSVTEELVRCDNCILSDDQLGTTVTDQNSVHVSDDRVDWQCVEHDANDHRSYTDSKKAPAWKRLKADDIINDKCLDDITNEKCSPILVCNQPDDMALFNTRFLKQQWMKKPGQLSVNEVETARGIVETSLSSEANSKIPSYGSQQLMHQSDLQRPQRTQQSDGGRAFLVHRLMRPPQLPRAPLDYDAAYVDSRSETNSFDIVSRTGRAPSVVQPLLHENVWPNVQMSQQTSFIHRPLLVPQPSPLKRLFSPVDNSMVLQSRTNEFCSTSGSQFSTYGMPPIHGELSPVASYEDVPKVTTVFSHSLNQCLDAGYSHGDSTNYSFQVTNCNLTPSETSPVNEYEEYIPAFTNTFNEIRSSFGSSSRMAYNNKQGDNWQGDVSIDNAHGLLETRVSNEYGVREHKLLAEQLTYSEAAYCENTVWQSAHLGQTIQNNSEVDFSMADCLELASNTYQSDYGSTPCSSLNNSSETRHPMPNRKNPRLRLMNQNQSAVNVQVPIARKIQHIPFQMQKQILNSENCHVKNSYEFNSQKRFSKNELACFQSEEVPDSWEDIDVSKESGDCCNETFSGDEQTNIDWFSPTDSLLHTAKHSNSFVLFKYKPTFSNSTPVDNFNNKRGSWKHSSSSAAQGREESSCPSVSAENWKLAFWSRYSSITVPFIDSHCHIDFMYKRTGFAGTFEKFRATQSELFPPSFAGCIAVFCKPDTWIYESPGCLFNSILQDSKVWGAVGCHPKHAVIFTDKAEAKLRAMLKHDKVMALGEIGLDYSGSFYQHHECQKEVLRRQVRIALEFNLPLVIHSRDSEQDMIDELEKLVPRNYRIHRHCFTGSWAEAERWLQKFPGSYIGVTPLVTYAGNRNAALRDMVKNIPLEKLLLETDAPYFPPKQVPNYALYHSGSHPGFAITVAETIAELRCISINEVLEACLRNTKLMYGI